MPVILFYTGFTLWQVAIIERPWPIFFKLTFWVFFWSFRLTSENKILFKWKKIRFNASQILYILANKVWHSRKHWKFPHDFEICVLIDLKTIPRDLTWLFIFVEKGEGVLVIIIIRIFTCYWCLYWNFCENRWIILWSNKKYSPYSNE